MNEEQVKAMEVVHAVALERAEHLESLRMQVPEHVRDEKPSAEAFTAMLVAKWCHDEVAKHRAEEELKEKFILERVKNVERLRSELE